MLIGILHTATDRRAPLVPDTVRKLLAADHSCWFEPGVGAEAFFSDQAYIEAGAEAQKRSEILQKADLIVCLDAPTPEEIATIPAGKRLIGMFNPLVDTALAERFKAQKLEAYSLDRIPRTTIAQSMDVLSSMASLAITATRCLPVTAPSAASKQPRVKRPSGPI